MRIASWWKQRLHRFRTHRAHGLLLHSQLLGERLYLYSLARFLVVAAIVAGSLFATRVVGVQNLESTKLFAVALALCIYNLIIFILVRPCRNSGCSDDAEPMLTRVMHATILLDFLFLTIALWLVGGARSPFQVFYLFNVILASVLLSRRAAFLHTALAFFLLAELVIGEWLGIVPSCSPIGAVCTSERLDGRYVITLLVVYGTLFSLSTLILTSLVALLRAGEERLMETNNQLEALSAARRDFLHILVHDLKAPIVAVSQHLSNIDMYLSPKMTEQESRWLDRCQTRVKELMLFLNDLQVLAMLGSEGIKKQAHTIALSPLLEAVVNEGQDLARLRNHTMMFEAPAELPSINGIERLIREAVMNLITNAVKYTPNGGRIAIRAASTGNRVRIEVRDNGIGISCENQKLLFQEFSRIRTEDPNNVDVTASNGLGLAIVRRIVTLHGGTVGVESEVGVGSTFHIELPVATSL